MKFLRGLVVVCVATYATVVGAVAASAAGSSGPCGNGTITYAGSIATCTYAAGGSGTFTAPSSVTSVAVTAIGGMGGGGFETGFSHNAGGFGAQVTTTLAVSSASPLTIQAAGNGANGNSQGSGGAAGAGGGGGGGVGRAIGGGGGGGGESTVLDGASALVIAAGGGGGGAGNPLGPSPTGGNADSNGNGVGGAGAAGGQSGSNGGAGGAASHNGGNAGGNGGADQGGVGGSEGSAGGGGGGGGAGMLGGGGGGGSVGGDDSAGGGGGSSVVTGQNGAIATDSTGKPLVQLSWIVAVPTISTQVDDQQTNSAWAGSEITGAAAYDTASLGALARNMPPTGAVTYALFDANSCAGSPASTEPSPLNGDGSLPDSSPTGPLEPGTYSFQATYSGDGDYASVVGSCDQFTVDKTSQTITFPTAAVTYGQADFSPASADSGLAVTYSDATGGCAVTNNQSQLEITAAGSCTATANQAGDNTYDEATPVEQTFPVDQAVAHVDADPASTAYGTADPSPTATLREADFVNGDTEVTGNVSGAASCAIASHSPDTGTYPAVISCGPGTLSSTDYSFATGDPAALTIAQSPQSISLTSTPPATPTVGGAYRPAAAATSGLAVVFSIDSSSKAGACSLSGGLVSFTTPGSCVIDANQAGNGNFLAAPQLQQALQIAAVPRPRSTTLRLKSSAHLALVGKRLVYTARLTPVPDGGRISFFEAARRIAGCQNLKVSAAGVATCAVRYRKAGSHTIQARYVGDSHFASSRSNKLKQKVRRKHRR